MGAKQTDVHSYSKLPGQLVTQSNFNIPFIFTTPNMKTNIFCSRHLLFLLFSFSLSGCIKYKEIADCSLRAGFHGFRKTLSFVPEHRFEVQFTNNSQIFTGLEYEWDFRDNSHKEFIANPKHSFAPGKYRVLLTVRLGEGCMDTFPHNILVLDAGPMAVFTTDKNNEYILCR